MANLQSMTNINGEITKTEDARIPVLDRGFLYGDSVYEVFRTYDGVPMLYEEHWTRLENSAGLIQMDVSGSRALIAEQIRRTVRATGADRLRQDVYVRYIITRGAGAIDLYPDPELLTRYVIIVKEAPTWNRDFYSRGMRIAIPATRRNPLNALNPNIKGGNYLNNVMGVIEARRRHDADDCVMLNDEGLVTEASNSNVFFVIDGDLVTPAQTAGNLRGLTKAAVRTACQQNGLASVERDIAAHELPRATECFVTSATREVMPVVSLRLEDGKLVEFPPGGGEITRRVVASYKGYIANHVRDNASACMFEPG
ncbi:MAG: aminotransferase class IV [Proteobacteria bacterium]|nr:aminotransferase class IV [Pseudomonadota bacterium]